MKIKTDYTTITLFVERAKTLFTIAKIVKLPVFALIRLAIIAAVLYVCPVAI